MNGREVGEHHKIEADVSEGVKGLDDKEVVEHGVKAIDKTYACACTALEKFQSKSSK